MGDAGVYVAGGCVSDGVSVGCGVVPESELGVGWTVCVAQFALAILTVFIVIGLLVVSVPEASPLQFVNAYWAVPSVTVASDTLA